MKRWVLQVAALVGSLVCFAACSSSNGGEGTDGGPTGSSSGSSGSSASSGGSGSGSVSGGSSGSSTGGAGSSTVSGTIGGQTLTVNSVLAGTATNSAIGGTGTSVNVMSVYVTSIANACVLGTANPNVNIHDAQSLLLVVATTAALAPGTFDLAGSTGDASSDATATAEYSATNATCDTIADEEAVGGTITIATITSSELTGTFDAMLSPVTASGTLSTTVDHVTGSFSAPICPALSASLNGVGDAGGTESDAAAPCN